MNRPIGLSIIALLIFTSCEGWVLEYKRKLTVESSLKAIGDKQGVDFGSLEDQVFGIGVFDNAAIAHSIKPGLLLKFEKQ